MIDLHMWPTPNGHKISIFLEEAGVPYRIVPVNIRKGEQFTPEFLAISPNNRMPAIVDTEPQGGGGPISVFESGAILEYLGEKYGKFFGTNLREKTKVREWLAWQVGGVGPMFGQFSHFNNYAPEKIPYAIERYKNEAHRLVGVLQKQLAAEAKAFVAGEYSIADMAIWPWAMHYDRFGIDKADFPNFADWVDRVAKRPAVVRALAAGEALQSAPAVMDDEARKNLFGQRARA